MSDENRSAGQAGHDAGEAMRRSAQEAGDAFRDHVVEPMRRAGDAARASGEKLASDGSAIGARMIDQAEANAREAFAAMRAAAGAKDPAEVVRIQGDYLREQGQRSMAQAREIGDLIAQFGRNALGTLRPAADGTAKS